jgi:hypothetical protein
MISCAKRFGKFGYTQHLRRTYVRELWNGHESRKRSPKSNLILYRVFLGYAQFSNNERMPTEKKKGGQNEKEGLFTDSIFVGGDICNYANFP